MLKIGSTEITKIFLGSNELEKAYIGSILVYDRVAPITTATITVVAGTGIASVSGGGEYQVGSDASVSATVNSGYVFKHWAESSTPGTSVSTDNPYTFEVTADRDLTAIGESSSPEVPSDEIWYTTSDGIAITLSKQTSSDWGANVTGNTYSGGKGIIKFDGAVTKLGAQVLDAKSTITTIKFPNSITTIGNYAMRDCSSLIEITIPENVTDIGQKAFANCTSLETINFNATNCTCASVSGTSSMPFSGITTIATVNVGANVTRFGKYLFGSSSSKPKYTTIYMNGSTPPACDNSNALPGTANVTTISIPAGSKATYTGTPTWSSYSSKLIERG